MCRHFSTVSLSVQTFLLVYNHDTVTYLAGGLSSDELPASEDESDKADMRIVQAASQEVLSKHSSILSRGLMVTQPTIQQILSGEIPIIRDSIEQSFLTDFIESKTGTPGGRLAR